MEEESSLTRWLGEPAQSQMTLLMADPNARSFLAELRRGAPETPDGWRRLVVSSSFHGSAPVLEALLDRVPPDVLSGFEFYSHRSEPVADDCFALLVDRVWQPQIGTLKTLRITGVMLSAFAVSRIAGLIGDCTALETLSLKHCGLTSDLAAQIWTALLDSKCPVRTLDLSFNSIAGTLVRAEELGRYPRSLRHLKLACAEVFAEDASALARMLAAWKLPETLNLCGNPMGDASGAELLRAAAELPALAVLDLSGCALEHSAADRLVDLIAKTRSLKVLRLTNNDFSHLQDGLGAAMRANRSLEELHLKQTGLVAKSVNDLFGGLAHPECALALLDLDHNHLIALDARPLARNASLTRLQLVGNDLGAAAYQTLAEMLSAHPSLARLDLGMTFGDETSMKHLVDGLERNGSLRTLYLRSAAELTANQVKALLKAIERNSQLYAVHIPYSLVDQPDIKSLFEATLKSNLSITDFSGHDFEWFPNFSLREPINRYLIRNQRADDRRLLEALRKVIEKCVMLGCDSLNDDVAREIGLMLLGDVRAKSLEALQSAVRLREVNKALASVPMPEPRPKPRS